VETYYLFAILHPLFSQEKAMVQHFEHEGISFRYPAGWCLEREDADGGWGVSLQSPGTAFLVLRCDESMPTMEEMAETALEALRTEYPELEADACVERLAGQMAVGHDIQFFQFDLTNTCWTRSFYSDAGTVLVLCQASDLETDTYVPVLKAVCASLKLEEE
jgi:hypothetical protein